MWLSDPRLNMLEVETLISAIMFVFNVHLLKKYISIVAPLSLNFTLNMAHILWCTAEICTSGFLLY